MNTITNTYINAMLADAAYVDLIKGLDRDKIASALGERMTSPQAQFIAKNFEVIATENKSDNPLVGSGFDAIVWRGKAGTDYAGKVYVSMRGTEPNAGGADLTSDADLASRGIPYNQIRDMANWWLRATAKAGTDVKQVKVTTLAGAAGLNLYTFAADTSVKATGELYGQVGLIAAVNGHSLGGYLATAFTRLFGANTLEVNTFNSAGFSDAAASNIRNEFNKLEILLGSAALGMRSFEAAGAKQTNYRAGNGVSVTTNNWGERPYWAVGFNQYGSKVALYQEDLLSWNPIANHALYKQTDYLALGTMLSRLNASLSLDTLASLVKASSNDMKASYEGVLDAVRQLVSPTRIKATQVGDAGDSATTRVDFHVNLSALQDNVTFKALTGKVIISANAASAVKAKTDFGQFLSLYDLTPFSISVSDAGAKTALLNARSDVASKWQSLADNFSDKWLQDRAEMQSHLLQVNNADNQGVITGQPQSASALYEDMASGKTVKVGTASVTQMCNVRFGDDKANVLNGGALSDDLFGGAGNDTLVGNGGRDWLEGGTGVDLYQAGQGDTIFDCDGQGLIELDGKKLSGATKRLSSDRWEGQFGESYSVLGSDLVITLDSSQIVVKNGCLAVGQKPFLGLTLVGDIPALDNNITTYRGTSQRDVWEWRRTQGSGFFETSGKETFIMGDGDDQVASTAGGDNFMGENGNDVFIATEGDNYALGGDGNDVLADGVLLDYSVKYVYIPGQSVYYPYIGFVQLPGTWSTQFFAPNINREEILHASSKVLMHSLTGTMALPTDSQDTLSGGQGDDWVMGGGGDDLLDGGQGSDVVYGGTGDDEIEGGEGDDILSGDDLALVSAGANHGADVIDGGAGNDKIFGNGGNDVISAGAGDDLVWGDDEFLPLQYHGDDVIYGQEGNDTIYAGGGNDWINAGDGDDLAVGGEGDDDIFGGDGNDRLIGDLPGASDVYEGQKFYASVTGASINIYKQALDKGEVSIYQPKAELAQGNDRLFGGQGDDTLWGGAGFDELSGGVGSDTYIFNQGDGFDWITEDDGGFAAVDSLVLGQGLQAQQMSVSTSGDDLILSWAGGDGVLITDYFSPSGQSKIERVLFWDGTVLESSTLDAVARGAHLGGESSDTIFGSAADEVFFGMGGNDRISGNQGNDTLSGGAGDDLLIGGEGRDVLQGGAGVDTASYADVLRNNPATGSQMLGVRADLTLGTQEDLLQSTSFVTTSASLLAPGATLADLNLDGTSFVLKGGWIPGQLDARAILVDRSSAGQATLWACAYDGQYTKAVQLKLLDTAQGATVQLLQAKYTAGDVTNGSFDFNSQGKAVSLSPDGKQGGYGVASVLVGKLGDTLTDIENLTGGNYADQLTGNAQANVLVGGLGNDTLTGGAGADKFVFNTALGANNNDVLTDFSVSQGDQIVLDQGIFTMLAGKTNLANHFRLSTQAPVGGDDYLVYNKATGQLYYDALGNGSATAQLFATLANKPQDLTAQQFAVL